ncbi:MAG: sugar ABC transporter permease, partial [Methanomassiliicoccales archaeon]|nr:sugar ABC transporter permease [Methanomassiliicoccales archaeon]
ALPHFPEMQMQIVPAHKRNALIAVQFVAPAAIMIVLFIVFPIGKTVVMAFQDWYLASGRTEHAFIGFKNFSDALSNSNFVQMAWVTALYTVLGVAGKMYIGLGGALLLNQEFRGRAFVRGLMLIPWAMPAVVACTVFMISLDPTYGILNSMLVKAGILKGPLDFFSGKALALGTVIAIGIWKNFPFVTLMILAALQGIPKDYYDAAAIDGAGVWRRFRAITMPSIRPIWNTLLILETLWTVKEFELVYLITKGGPDSGTAIIGVDIYLNAFRFYKLGTASAEGLMLLVLSLAFASVYFKQQKKLGA